VYDMTLLLMPRITYRNAPAAALRALPLAACGGEEKITAPPLPDPQVTVTLVVVAPTTATLLEGDSVDLRATGTLSNGSSSTTRDAWSSGAPTVVSVSSGHLTALSAGEATITIIAVPRGTTHYEVPAMEWRRRKGSPIRGRVTALNEVGGFVRQSAWRWVTTDASTMPTRSDRTPPQP